MTDHLVEIGNAIIAGIADGDTILEKMTEVVDHLRLAGFVIVPISEAQPQSLAGCLHPHTCKKLGECRDPGLCNHKGPMT